MNVALYARYSSDQQRETSIEDQLALCRQYAERQAWRVSHEYTDARITGATLLLRPGIQRLMQDAGRRHFDILLAESLDRFSRDQEDTAALFKRLRFVGVRFVTLAEGEITELHVGFKGTMNALYLKDLAEKTRRGMRGRVTAGRSGGGRSYAYRVVRRPIPEGVSTGEREIHAGEAEVVRRIFRDYADGASPKSIAKMLNREGVPGPFGGVWSPSTIHGNPQRGVGLLNNELYIGRLVWNRMRYIRDPDTGKRVSRPNPPSEWVTTTVEELRIVADELWARVKERQESIRAAGVQGGRTNTRELVRYRRPKYLFSGLTTCASCGGGVHVYTGNRLACYAARARGTCTNRLTIRREEVERRVLTALREKLLNRELFEEFCEEFTRELNRLRMAERALQSSARHELERVEQSIGKLIEAIEDGLSASSIRDKLNKLEDRRAELKARVNDVREMPPLLHPGMADLYRAKVGDLCQALEREDARAQASEAIRGLLDGIILEPDDRELRILVKGNLASMLRFAQNAKRSKSPELDDLERTVSLVAGAGFEPATFGL
jgi:site-specific DNA recombinase